MIVSKETLNKISEEKDVTLAKRLYHLVTNCDMYKVDPDNNKFYKCGITVVIEWNKRTEPHYPDWAPEKPFEIWNCGSEDDAVDCFDNTKEDWR
ncbi:MAG: hypothetical protein CL464_11185 [Acidimicrobiaceae bacterium]|jgi:hypothetical protein|nr:hypothetical protein [Acidimicrobiaceae bacterium]|tara:strand:+ start:8864 stop:9145 length:282 start_codon:yes stop_codon:yes gene_type:complete